MGACNAYCDAAECAKARVNFATCQQNLIETRA